jgi:hypothetical protein
MKRTFILHWLGGKEETVEGEGADQHTALADAFRRAGYGGGAIRALDYWEEKVIKCKARRARLDPDGTCKPMTKIIAHHPTGVCVGPASSPNSYTIVHQDPNKKG